MGIAYKIKPKHYENHTQNRNDGCRKQHLRYPQIVNARTNNLRDVRQADADGRANRQNVRHHATPHLSDYRNGRGAFRGNGNRRDDDLHKFVIGSFGL